MKRAHYFLITLFLLTIMPKLTAQPFTLDEEIKPQLLELRDNPQGEGAKGSPKNLVGARRGRHERLGGFVDRIRRNHDLLS